MENTNTFITKPVARMPFPFRVDIIIPYHGQYGKVTALIESIFRFTRSNVYHIILVDDFSSNTAFSSNLSKVPNITTVRTPSHLGFGGALKVGFQKSEELNAARKAAKKTQHPFVVFMQSDCEIEGQNWLTPLGQALMEMRSQGVMMVSPKTDNPMGGDPRQKGEKFVPGDDAILEKTHLSLYCFLCHRELFGKIGGFLKDYPYGYFEDEELAYRMRMYGYKQAVVGSSWIKHIGQSTIRDLWRDKQITRKIMTEDNRKKCIEDIRALNKLMPTEKPALEEKPIVHETPQEV